MDIVNTSDSLHHSWEVETTSERENGDDANLFTAPISSSFTAINQQPTQLSTSQSSAIAPIQQNQARRRATSTARRRHNPIVAQYLGLGRKYKPTHLEKDALHPTVPESPPPKPARKRRRLADGDNILSGRRANADGKDAPNRQRISESFSVTKPARKSTATRSKTSASEASQSPFTSTKAIQTASTDDNTLPDAHQVSHCATRKNGSSISSRTISQDTVPTSHIEDLIDDRLFDLEADDCDINDAAQFNPTVSQHQIGTPNSNDDDFDNDISDDDLLMLTSSLGDTSFDHANDLSSSSIKNDPVVEQHRKGRSLDSSAYTLNIPDGDTSIPGSQRSLNKFVSPVTLNTRLLAASGDVGFAQTRKPIARPPFPNPARDRSPIIGLSSNVRLRTCFRIGEAINQGCHASKSGEHVIIELYARVLDSERTDTQQHFTFCDLFHAKPPYIKGMYAAAIWKPVQLFEYDSRRLLQEGRMCRCIGIMKRDGKVWVMTVLNIWEATWEDIKWVEGIVSF